MTKDSTIKKDNKRRFKDDRIISTPGVDSYIRRARAKKIFKEWLKDNLHRFQ